ncbi:cation:proton antiporter subunit C [Halorussus ruber]|uniref:cation:proton antiporter subunit C n=1 Tax=Halorussus ruber TaxID=1126238 RepID=UPI001091DCB5|nr:cation:proton antiporter subunit C [Halorussus ruber]
MLEAYLDRLPYLAAVALVAIGLGVLVGERGRLKKVLGINVFQTGILLFLVAAAYRTGGRAPLARPATADAPSVNPLPHVLVLTAIVVGVSLTALALALVIRVRREETMAEEGVGEETMGEGGESV